MKLVIIHSYEMAKITFILVLVGVVNIVQGNPATYDEVLAAAKAGQWEQLQDFSGSQSESIEELPIQSDFPKEPIWKTSMQMLFSNTQPSFSGVRDLKPPQGGKVFGEAQYSFHSASNIDGKTTEDHAGHKVINDNGKVEEFDFTPSNDKNPFSLLTFKDFPKLKPLQFPIMDSIFHSATAIEDIQNNNGHLFPLKMTFNPYTSNLHNPKSTSGGKVFGEADFTFHSSSNINGKKSEEHAGHKIINDNGNIQEFKYKPVINEKSLFSPLTHTNVRDLKPPKGGHVYGESEYAFQSTSNINGQTSEDKGGHKVINNDGKVKEFDFTPSSGLKPLSLSQLSLSPLDKDISDFKSFFTN